MEDGKLRYWWEDTPIALLTYESMKDERFSESEIQTLEAGSKLERLQCLIAAYYLALFAVEDYLRPYRSLWESPQRVPIVKQLKGGIS